TKDGAPPGRVEWRHGFAALGAHVVTVDVALRQRGRGGDAASRSGLANPRGRDLQIEVAVDRTPHETIEHRIAKRRPPLFERSLIGGGGGGDRRLLKSGGQRHPWGAVP